jgi:putative MATE family efflux protein
MEQTSQNPVSRHGRDMTSGSIPRHLVVFSLPMLAGNVIQTAYSIVNAIWVGKGLGKADLAAVTVSFPIVFMLMSLAIGLTTGTGILIAQFAGARDWERLRKVVQSSTSMQIGISAIILTLGEVFTPTIMRAMDTPANAYPLAVGYMRIFICGTPCVFGTIMMVSMLRGIGDSKTPLYFQGGALLLTAILDPILMFGWLGFPRLGLNGTAVAAVTTQALGLVAALVYLHRKDHLVAPNWLRLSIDWPTFWLIVKIGLPSVVQQSMVSLGAIFVLRFVNAFGENATAAFGAGTRIDQVAFLPAMTFNLSVSTLVGQNIGAGQLQRVKEVFRWSVALAGGITLCVSLLAFIFPHILLRMFLNDPAVMRMGIVYLHTVAFSYVLFAVMFVSNGVLNGSGHTLVTTVGSLVSLWVARVPLAAYLSHRLHRVEGVWYAIVISSVVSMSISLLWYYSGLWKKPVVRHGVPAAPPVQEHDEPVPAA